MKAIFTRPHQSWSLDRLRKALGNDPKTSPITAPRSPPPNFFPFICHMFQFPSFSQAGVPTAFQLTVEVFMRVELRQSNVLVFSPPSTADITNLHPHSLTSEQTTTHTHSLYIINYLPFAFVLVTMSDATDGV
jgi:hypothetical protein